MRNMLNITNIITKKMIWQIIAAISAALFVLVILFLSIRGLEGTPNAKELNTKTWKEAGPFELSPERGRFGLTYSLVENDSFHFSLDVAKFITPDLGYWKGNYVSLFAPGVSLIVIPGYIFGKSIGLSQVGTFAMIALFAAANFFLVKKNAQLLGANNKAGLIAGIIFLFATPAYAYAVNLYQHHISTFIILLSIFLLIKYGKKWWALFLVWALCAISLIVDYPNFFMMAPVGIAALISMVTIHQTRSTTTTLSFNFKLLFTILGVVVPLIMFAMANYYSYGNPTQLAGTVPTVSKIDAQGKPVFLENVFDETTKVEKVEETSSAVGFFHTRKILDGLYIHIFSPDRGILVYAPIILFGLLGIYTLHRKKNPFIQLPIAIVCMNIILYSMWGDPWGGWAFGSRYLIPTYAVMAIFIGVALSTYARYKIFSLLVLLVMSYSIAVNTLGALTSSTNPPQVQVLSLEEQTGRVQKYTYERNIDYLTQSGSKSYVYQTYAEKYMSAVTYYAIITAVIIFVAGSLLIVLTVKGKKE